MVMQTVEMQLIFGPTANVPSVNSMQAILMAQERPIMFAALKQIQKKLGRSEFPLVVRYIPDR